MNWGTSNEWRPVVRVMSDHGQCQVISCHVCIAYVQSNPCFLWFLFFMFCSRLWDSWLCISAPRVTSFSSAQFAPFRPSDRPISDRGSGMEMLCVFVLALMIIIILCIFSINTAACQAGEGDGRGALWACLRVVFLTATVQVPYYCYVS